MNVDSCTPSINIGAVEAFESEGTKYVKEQFEEAERYWFAFILYSIKKLTQKIKDSEKEVAEKIGLTLCRILRAAKLKYFANLFASI
ncbi:hypothetical protein RJT34_02868 [Clitoria ternatea]|uniref:Uncharacterized protein n=1 Tax=Clitoria ternatea TaxID=43366 RepID=A0AAN9Q1Z9_CLITE